MFDGSGRCSCAARAAVHGEPAGAAACMRSCRSCSLAAPAAARTSQPADAAWRCGRRCPGRSRGRACGRELEPAGLPDNGNSGRLGSACRCAARSRASAGRRSAVAGRSRRVAAGGFGAQQRRMEAAAAQEAGRAGLAQAERKLAESEAAAAALQGRWAAELPDIARRRPQASIKRCRSAIHAPKTRANVWPKA